MSVFLLATLDTKGREAQFVRECLEAEGVTVTMVDTGCVGQPQVPADVTREAVFQAAGTSLATQVRQGDRGEAVTAAAKAPPRWFDPLTDQASWTVYLAWGGSAGTSIGTAAMGCLPLGIPKVMVSTLASGDVRAFVGVRDIVMVNSVVDISGLNRISRTILAEAAAALAGMVKAAPITDSTADRPIVAATMFGVTTACVEQARRHLEQAGYEVLVFHATGTGGQAMEGLIRDGLIAGVLDITTTELADEIVGGVLSAGPQRLTSAGERGIPQIVSVGATDMVNFWALETVPPQFQQRKLYKHNENVTLMRTTADECRQIGTELARKVSAATGPVQVMLPLQGVSAIDCAGQPFDDPEARSALFDAIRRGTRPDAVIEFDQHINDREFATAAAQALIDLL